MAIQPKLTCIACKYTEEGPNTWDWYLHPILKGYLCLKCGPIYEALHNKVW